MGGVGSSPIIPHRPYMSPPDMDGIARIKGPNKGKQFQTEDELISDFEATIREVNKNQESRYYYVA